PTTRRNDWWVSFTGLYASSASCPCCGGGQGCVAGAGFVGFLLALGTLIKYPFRRLRARRAPAPRIDATAP
ncbi:MAG: hypothetical protein AAFZ18_35800, partial [Myxococcota bacterium]